MKYIFNPFTPIPKSEKSHVRGWSMYWSKLLGAEILGKDLSCLKSSDVVYLDHGVNFSGSLNLFGGVDDEVFERLSALLGVRPKLVSLDIEMPDYAEMLIKRLGASSTCKKLTYEFIMELKKYFKTAKFESWQTVKSHHLTIGDSHSTAFNPRGGAVLRINGKTLHGFLNSYKSIIGDLSCKPYKELKGITLVFGSIDIRHHILRNSNPKKSLNNLLVSYIELALLIEEKWNVDVELACPVPVEWEGRKIPKTGWYEGTPFFGSYKERAEITKLMCKYLKTNWAVVIEAPKDWYTMDPKEYAEKIMELSSSVHIAPCNYRSERFDQPCSL